MFKEVDIIKQVKNQIYRACHVTRRENDDITKLILLNKIEGIKRKRSRPKTGCTEWIEGGLKRLEVVNWGRMALERFEWGIY